MRVFHRDLPLQPQFQIKNEFFNSFAKKITRAFKCNIIGISLKNKKVSVCSSCPAVFLI